MQLTLSFLLSREVVKQGVLLAFSGQLVEQAKVSLAVNPFILTVTRGGETRGVIGIQWTAG